MSCMVIMSSCSTYDNNFIIGKTSSEIEEKYGDFDYTSNPQNLRDGNYFKCKCAYKTKEEKVGFLGTDPAEYYAIVFDEDGIAISVYEKWFVPGG